jgi:hypothetical protein
VPDLQQAIKRLGGSVKSHSSKMELCKQIHDLNPNYFERTKYVPLTRREKENKRAMAKAMNDQAAAERSRQASVGEQRR